MKFTAILTRTLEVFLIFIMSVLVIDVLWQVTSRYLLANPSAFTDEVAGFLLIWVGMLGAAYVSSRNEHLAIDLLLQKTRESRKRNLEILINILVFLFALTVMLIGGSWLVYTRFALEVQSASLELPLGIVYSVMPLSGLIIMYFKGINLYHLLKLKN